MVDRAPLQLRDDAAAQDVTSLKDMQPSVLRSASASPLMESPLDRASSRVEQVIETMASYRGAKTPQLNHLPPRNPQGALKDIIREKESELASIAAQRSRVLAEQLEQSQEQERKGKDEIIKLRSQLKQLTKDFKYNLDLLKDRDAELELMENQIKAHKDTAEQRSQELADAIRRIDEAKLSMVSCENRAEQALAHKAAAEERCARKLTVAQREHDAAMSDVLSQLEASKAQLQHEMAKLVDERQGLSTNHRHKIEHLEGELADARGRIHTVKAETEEAQLQLKQSTARCDKAEKDLRVAEDALGSLENEHRKFVNQASAVCSQKDEAIADLKAQIEVEKRLSYGQAMHDSHEHRARIKDLEAEVKREKELVASADKELHAAQAELLSCKAEHQKEVAESQLQLTACQTELAACQREMSLVHQSFATMEHEKDGDAGRSGELLAQAHMELQQRDREMQHLQQDVATLREELRCSECSRNAACQQLQQITADMEKMSLVHKTDLERAEERAQSAETRIGALTKDKRALASAIEKQASAWSKKFESQAKSQRHQIAHLEQQWHTRLVQAQHEHADHVARQSAETAGVKDECNVAISRIRDAQDYVHLLEEQLHGQTQVAILPSPSQPPALAPVLPPPPRTTPASPMQAPLVYSTTVNVPPSQNSSGVSTCQCGYVASAPNGASQAAGTAPDQQMRHSAPMMPCVAANLSNGAACAPPMPCVCGQQHGMHGQAARAPLADTANIPMVQHGAPCMQRVPSTGYWSNYGLGCSGHPVSVPVTDRKTVGKQFYSGRHRSASLIRMQRLQDRLKASERDLSYRLGRLLGHEASDSYSGAQA
eukprot:jgi/Ulvmu1/7030/UM033_0089.1